MTEFKEYTLGPQAMEFLKENRRRHRHTLSKYLLARLDLGAGKITTCLPPDVTSEHLYDFNRGGVLPFSPRSQWVYTQYPDGTKKTLTPVPRDDTVVIQSIAQWLRKGPEQLCIMEEFFDTAGKALKRRPAEVPLVIFDEEVYYLLPASTGEDPIRQALKWAYTTFTFLAALTSLPQGHTGIHGWSTTTADVTPTVTRDELETLAERTEQIIIGAYDGEGYLIWHEADT